MNRSVKAVQRCSQSYSRQKMVKTWKETTPEGTEKNLDFEDLPKG